MKRFLMALAAMTSLAFAGSALAETDVSARGGVEGFTGGGPVGPLAGVQVDGSVNNYAGIEVSYDGARLPEGSGLWAHDLNAQARLSPLPMAVVRPYVAAGIGAGYFEPQDGNFGNGVWSGQVPLSAGLAFGRLDNINIGVRGDYKIEFNRDLPIAGSPGGNMASGELTLGGRF